MRKKYIDADKLIAEIEKRLKNVRDYMNGAGMKYKGPKYYKAQGKESAYDALLNVIDSLQQDETQVDKMLCSKVWWEEQGWIMIPPDATIEGIDSLLKQIRKKLQYEQPEISNNLVDIDAVREDFITEVYRVLDADPTNDRANAIIDAFDSLPTVSQEQPEVDLEKITKYSRIKELPDGFEKEWLCYYHKNPEYNSAKFSHLSLIEREYIIARHFYELGRNARKEE